LAQEGVGMLLHVKVDEIAELEGWKNEVPFELYCDSLVPQDYQTLKELVPQAKLLCNVHEAFD